MKKKILIVDDEQNLARALEIKLQEAGLDTKVVFGGKECLDELKSNRYDLMLLDLMMPEVDGWAVLEELSKQKNMIKTVITTNLSQDRDQERARQMGVTDFVVKSDITLEGMVNQILPLL